MYKGKDVAMIAHEGPMIEAIANLDDDDCYLDDILEPEGEQVYYGSPLDPDGRTFMTHGEDPFDPEGGEEYYGRGGHHIYVASYFEETEEMVNYEPPRIHEAHYSDAIYFTELAVEEVPTTSKPRGVKIPRWEDIKDDKEPMAESNGPEMKEQGVTEDRLQLLREVTAAFRPGVLTALMGVSGAGKTTLMDVLAGRKTGGYIEGDIRISGFPKIQETFARISGYCQQMDIHSPQVTIRESLIYSAFLRLPKEVSKEEKMVFVDEVMDLVELDNPKDAIVGLLGVTGLSTEQRKRLTIAVELVANPSIIFMDEPTSSLDARAAAIVMRTVRNTVDTGQTVVCTIYPPSIDIFEAFDELLLMKRGGQVIYSGPLGRNSPIPGIPKIKEKYNPATWMLEASSVAAEVRLGIDFAEHYKSSSLHQRNKALVKELSVPPPGTKDLYFTSQFSQPNLGQFQYCLWKLWLTNWRSPDYNLVRMFFTLACGPYGLINFLAGWQKKDNTGDLTTIIGAMYAAVLFVGINNCQTVQLVVAIERTVFYREKAAGMYSALPYAMIVKLAFYLCISWCILWWASNGQCINSFGSFLYFTYYGMMTVSITPNHQVASILAATFYALFNLFSGFFIPRPKIPKWWIWYYWICQIAWTVYRLIVSQYGDVTDPITVPGMKNSTTVQWYVKNNFGYEPNFIGPVAGVLVGFAVFFAFMYAYYCIKTLNFQMRMFVSLSLSLEKQEQLLKLISRYSDVFAWSYKEMPGLDPDLVSHYLDVFPNSKPIKQAARKYHPDLEEKIKEEIEKLQHASFIRPIQYPTWLANIVPVKKKNGQIRVCVDFRDLNKSCPKDEFPLPHIDTLVDATSGHQMFSFMDGFSGYNQIKMAEEDAEKTVFRTSLRNFFYTVMPFGLKNAGATYQRAMTAIFHDMIHHEVEDYVDDLVVKSKKEEDHLRDLEKVFKRCQKFKMRMNPLKCAFGVTAEKFLGFLVHRYGIEADEDKVKSIKAMPPPHSQKELEKFLGKMSYIRRFIPTLAEISAPFGSLLKGDAKFKWNQEHQKAFERIKPALTSPQTMIAPQPGVPLMLYLTSTPKSIGALLVQDVDGAERPVYYISWKIRGAELCQQEASFRLQQIHEKIRRGWGYQSVQKDPKTWL
ncbi:unnamed protein product [Camellia sinensis]